MKRFTVPYGERNLLVEIDERNIAGIIGMPKIDLSRDDTTLAKALRTPSGPHSLRQFLNGARELSIVVNDGARPTRTAWVIDLLEEEIRDKDVHFVVATGAHPCPNESGLRKIFGSSYRRYGDCITIHDAREDNAHEYTGKTRYGNEVWLNKLVTGADK
ncbi:MAG: DUF2088 domain-containing protein, partial [candidate division WOR-3 bacterium]